MQTAEGHADRNHCAYSQRTWPSPFSEHHREQDAQQSENRSNRKIDSPRDNHKSQSDAEYTIGSDETGHVLQVGNSEKTRVENGYDDAQKGEQAESAQFSSHEASRL